MSENNVQVSERLEYLRGEIRAERISWGELAELQSLAEHIDPDDAELLEWAGVSEEDYRRGLARPEQDDARLLTLCKFCFYNQGQETPAELLAPQYHGGDDNVPAEWVPTCRAHFGNEDSWWEGIPEHMRLPAVALSIVYAYREGRES